MSPLEISVVVLACVFGGALLGLFIHSVLPDEQLSSEPRDVVRIGMAPVATMVGMVLGLLISSGKGFYDTQNTEVIQLASNIVLLDRILARYGPDAKEARTVLRSSVARIVELMWPRGESGQPIFKPSADSRGDALFDKIQELSPNDDAEKSLKAQAIGVAIQIGQTRWLMFAQKTTTVPMPLLAMLVFCLTVLFISFGLFARPNVTVVTGLFTSALAVSGAIYLIYELYQPYGELLRVSDAPLRAVLALLGQ